MSKQYGNNLPYRRRFDPEESANSWQTTHTSRRSRSRQSPGPQKQRKRSKIVFIGIGVVVALLLVAFGVPQFLRSEMLNYLPLVPRTLVGTVCTISPRKHDLRVVISLVDKNGKLAHAQQYQVNGDQASLQGILVKFPSFLHSIGLTDGFKLTGLVGSFTNTSDEQNDNPSQYPLNNGEDPVFFATHTLYSLLPNSQTYDLYTSPNGLDPVVDHNAPPVCGLPHPSA